MSEFYKLLTGYGPRYAGLSPCIATERLLSSSITRKVCGQDAGREGKV